MSNTITNTDNMIDSRDVTDRIEELINNEELTRKEAVELGQLEELQQQGKHSSDWEYGAQMVRHDYFETFIGELIDDCFPEVKQAMMNRNWPFCHLTLDTAVAAESAKMDYTTVTFDGVKYFIRN